MAKVDILFVDDKSGSMPDKQEKLSTRLTAFVGSLADVDWQLAITTTDTSNGKYGLNAAFFRANSDFVVVFLSDAKIKVKYTPL